MGLLDDAIRDHLDLKRRRGADPGEVERAEREALGPVRRNPTPSELADADAAAEPTGAPAYDQADEDRWSHDSLQEPAAEAGVETVYDEPPPEPVAGPSESPAPASPPFDDRRAPAQERSYEEESFERESFERESFERESFGEEPAHEPFATPPAPGPARGAGPETAEYDVEDALAAEDDRGRGDEGEDVLEETPEFLQDTPDHDRLWFEQRPPKDFDFDE